MGRFISEDPLGFGGGDVNLYAYVSGNPVNFIDPLGLLKLHLDGLDPQEQQLVNDAVSLLRTTGDSPAVVAYFNKFGYDIKTALTPGEGPDVYVDKSLNAHGDSPPISFDSLRVGNSCFSDSNKKQSIASTISHELGHLASNWYFFNNRTEANISDLGYPSSYSVHPADGPYGYTAEMVWWGAYYYKDTWRTK